MTHTQTQGADGAGTKTAGQAAYEEFWGPNALPYTALVKGDRTLWERTAAAILTKACEPWELCFGDPPECGSPLHGVFVAGMIYTERLLASLLNLSDYEHGDGSEDFDADATQSLCNILIGANLWDADENRPVSPAPAATPDVRSLLRTARSGLATYGAGAFEGTILQIDAILAHDPIFPAPAATPGVPDSVRALLDQEPELTTFAINPQGGPDVWVEGTNRFCREDGALEYREWARSLKAAVRALIAAHPAGQAGDAGEEDRQHAAEVELQEIADGAYGDNPMTRGAARDRLSTLHAMVDRKLERYRANKPAPDSTRTGAAETDLVETVARAIFEADEDLNDASEAELRGKGNHAAADCLAGPRARWDDPKNAPILDAFRYRAKKAIEALAARPEAPSDAGWSFDMAAAPRDGTPLDLWCHGRRSIDYRWDAEGRFGGWWSDTNHKHRHWRDRECLLADQPTAWRLADTPPSDPAPSGQAEG